MKKILVLALVAGVLVSAPQAHALDCPAGEGTAVDVNVTTGQTTYSCVKLSQPLPKQTTTPVAPAPVTLDTATVTDTQTATAPTGVQLLPTISSYSPILAFIQQLISLLMDLLAQLGA